MQRNKLFLILLLSPLFTWAQKTHTVGPKETLFSIGREYNVHPRELAEYNKIPFETGLKMGQVLKIPAEKKMAPVAAPAPVAPVTTVETKKAEVPKTEIKKDPKPADAPVAKKSEGNPIYHVVQKKENLYQISQRYNKVPISDIKKWNNLTSDGLNEGMNLIVGYADGKAAANTVQTIAKTETQQQTEKTPEPPKKAAEQPVVVKKTENVATKPTAVPVVNETPAVVESAPETKPAAGKDFQGGYFKSVYSGSSKNREEIGLAGSFKSTSGWDDGKYYCLYKDAPAGTIVKITHKTTGKVAYAKVLDLMPDIPKNNGYLIRMSNSAASALGSTTDSFDVRLEY